MKINDKFTYQYKCTNVITFDMSILCINETKISHNKKTDVLCVFDKNDIQLYIQ